VNPITGVERNSSSRPRRVSVAASVTQFTVAGLVVTLALAALTGMLARRAGAEEATHSFENVAQVIASLLTPSLRADPAQSDPQSQAALSEAVQALLAAGPVVRIKIWDASGQILWSDEPRLVGQVFPLRPEVRTALRTGTVVSDVSDLMEPENRYERGMGELLEAYVGVRASDGTPLLVETYEPRAHVATAARQTWLAFVPPTLGALLLLQLVQIPLAWRLARRLRRSQDTEAALLGSLVEASDVERRRVASEVHDHVVQDLTGLAYDLDAARLRKSAGTEDSTALLARTATGLRHTIADLRALLVDLTPTRVPEGGLEPALQVLAESLEKSGTRVAVQVDGGGELPAPTATLLFRCAQEALRNVAAHSRAEQVDVSVTRDEEGATMVIDDDGCGFDDVRLAESNAAGHLGLRTLGDLLVDAGGSLTASSAPGQGTRLVARVPLDVFRTGVRTAP
jgi:two-component system NarL family sensor kinase